MLRRLQRPAARPYSPLTPPTAGAAAGEVTPRVNLGMDGEATANGKDHKIKESEKTLNSTPKFDEPLSAKEMAQLLKVRVRAGGWAGWGRSFVC
jgi:hypothetical protein